MIWRTVNVQFVHHQVSQLALARISKDVEESDLVSCMKNCMNIENSGLVVLDKYMKILKK